jgi:hypothetical protein
MEKLLSMAKNAITNINLSKKALLLISKKISNKKKL